MSEKKERRRLPPPAFPPGMRRRTYGVERAADTGRETQTVEGALISPDAPMPERREGLSDALISPDEPIPQRRGELLEESQSPTSGIELEEEGVVVGMDLDAHRDPEDVVSGEYPHFMELMEAVSRLKDALHREGEAGLRTHHGMSRFEASLRAYCVGYLTGLRAEEAPPSVVEERRPTDG